MLIVTKMATTPYLVQRGRSSAFRIVIPADLRDVSRQSSLSSSLGRVDSRAARTIVLALAALWRGTFDEVRQLKANPRLNPLTRPQIIFDEAMRRHNRMLQSHLACLHELGLLPAATSPQHHLLVPMSPVEPQYAASPDLTALAALTANQARTTGNSTSAPPTPRHEEDCVSDAPATQPTPRTVADAQGPTAPPHDEPREVTLQAIIDEFITRGAPQGQLPMLKKHRSCLSLLGKLHGQVPIHRFTQTQVNRFFQLVNQMPPKGSKASTTAPWWEIASENDGPTIARGTFDSTHRASMGAFLAWAIGNHGDAGFPRHLSIGHIKYTGTRRSGINKQRGMREDELKRLIEGPEFRSFSQDPAQVHIFAAPHGCGAANIE